MPELPARVRPVMTDPPSERECRAIVARRQMEDGLLIHTLSAHYDREAARIDSETVFEASQAALDTELELLGWGLEQSRSLDSAAAAKLVAARVEGLSTTNSRNLARRFQ